MKDFKALVMDLLGDPAKRQKFRKDPDAFVKDGGYRIGAQQKKRLLSFSDENWKHIKTVDLSAAEELAFHTNRVH